MWVYKPIRAEDGKIVGYAVGFFDPVQTKWVEDSRHASPEAAIARLRYLYGAEDPWSVRMTKEQVGGLRSCFARLPV